MWTRSSRLALVALWLVLAVAWDAPARADKIDDLTRALMQDPSYKVRVQAALILGKLNDKRAVPALIQALHDENETVRGVAATSLGQLGDKSAANALMQSATNDSSDFVKGQAKKALELVAGGGGGSAPGPTPRPGARFYVAIDILGRVEPQWARMAKEALQRELQKLPNVTLAVAGGTPTKSLLSSHHLSGFVVDVNVQQLTAVPASGGQQIDCGLKAVVATFPEKSIKMMTQEGASLTAGSGPSEADSGKRDCLGAAVEAVRDDVGKFLRTQE
jgi:HEAT repeats